MLLTDRLRRIELPDDKTQTVFDALWEEALRTKGAVTAASKIMYARRVRPPLPKNIELSPDELDAVQAVLGRLPA